jgi:hypothetical protein
VRQNEDLMAENESNKDKLKGLFLKYLQQRIALEVAL